MASDDATRATAASGMLAASDGNGAGRREPRSNPFGNYSLLEAQRSSVAAGGSGYGSTAENPFANYSFKEAQSGMLDPSSPTVAARPPSPPDRAADVVLPDAGRQPRAERVESTAQRAAAPATAPVVQGGAPLMSSAQPWRGSSDGHAPGAAAAETATATATRASRSSRGSRPGSLPEANESAAAAAGGSGAVPISIEQYAIRALYEEFRDRSAAKIDAVVDLRLDREPNLAKYLEHGADPIFDRTLEKLGMLARRHPRVIIELLLVWRKTTIDAADEFPLEGYAASASAAVAGTAAGGGGAGPGSSGSFPGVPEPSKPYHQPAAVSRAHYIVRERKSLVSVYILCRALSAVVDQLDAPHLEGDLGDRLEELVFGQVKQVNPDNLRRSANRREIQDLYARLVGRISEIRFSSMSDRFIAELERIPMVGSSGSSDERIVVLLHNMRFIKLRVFPIDALEESSAFLLSCAKFYSRTSGSLRLKHAWATLLTELMMPIAAVVDVEVNLPELVHAIDIIYAKAMKMAAKVRHVTVAFPLAAATLCISRREAFHQRWLSLLEYCIQRLKDKQFRRVSMDAILRMLWVYLFRYPESQNVVLRRIDSLSRIFFPATKVHAWPKTVPPAAFVYFLVCAACYNFEFTMRQLLNTLLQTDSGWPGTTRSIGDAEPILDTLNPMRVALAFQALVNVAAIASSSNAGTGTVADSADAGSAGDGSAANGAGAAAPDPAAQSAPSLRPPFPGVAQLSGLDVFAADVQLGRSSRPRGRDSVAHPAGATYGAAEALGDGRSRTDSARINPDMLPMSISNALTTATSVVSRYCSMLYPVFGHYVLADERLWRQACSMPLFSLVVLTGSPFSLENTALLTSGSGRGDQRGFYSAQVAGAASGALVGAGPSGPSAAGAHTGTATSKAAVGSDDGSDRHFNDDVSKTGPGYASAAVASDAASGSAGGGPRSTADAIRHTAPRYPAERQAYIDLMTVHIRCLPRAQIFWEQIEPQRLIEMLVHSVLHVDQQLAAESRACLMDLLCPPSIASQYGPQGGGPKPLPAGMFATRTERLVGVTLAVVRATQALRAVDERYCHILVAGIFSCDGRSSISLVQPGDPLVDSPGIWPFTLPQFGSSGGGGGGGIVGGGGAGSGSRRFAHGTNLSTASATSNGCIHAPGDHADRAHTAVVANDIGLRGEEGLARHAYSSSGQLGDVGGSGIDAGPSSAAAAAAIAAALDAKARLEKTSSPSSSSSEPAVHKLNGGFLHVFLDLLHYLEVVLYEHIENCSPSDTSAAQSGVAGADMAAPDVVRPHTSGGGGDGEPTTADQDGEASGAMIGDRGLVEWARLVCAIEANAIALLCSSNARVRRLAVDVLYHAGVVRRILAALESRMQPRQPWIFRGSESAYEILNVMVPSGDPHLASLRADSGAGAAGQVGGGGSAPHEPLISDYWSVPFGAEAAAATRGPRSQQPLARLAASASEADATQWAALFPPFILRASRAIPDVMLIARTLVCQRLYQMQPLMNQYSEISVRPSGAGARSLAYTRATSIRMHEKASPTTLRTDLIGAFGSLFLFAVVSLPASDLTLRVGLGSALGESLAGVRSPKGGAGSSNGGAHSSIFGGGHGGGGGGASSSAGGGGSSSRSRLAKTIARKLAPLKSTSRNSKQEQGIGLASIAQLVRVASVILRSDNAPLRQQTALALAHTPSMYLHELLQELRPLADFLFDDGTSGLSHRNYLHVSGATGSATGGAGLMASLGHGSGSPGSGVLAALGSSPKPTPQQAQRTATGGTSTTQLAPHPSSKRRTGMAGGGSRTRESSGLGSDTEATSDSGNHGDKGGDSRSKSSTGSAASQVRGRRANSFDAAAVGSSMGTSHGDAGALGSGGAGLMVSSASNVAAAAAAVAAAVNAGASSSTAFQTRRRRLRLSLAQIYKHVSRQLDALDQNGHTLYMDGQIMAQLIAYVRETKTFLSESSAQWEWEHQPLRIHFCGLVEGLYYFMSSAAMADLQAEPHPTAGKRQQQQQQPSRGAGKTSAMFTHETRSGLYQLFERWCGLGRYSESSRDAQERMIAMAVDQLKDAGEKEHLAASLEDERQQLELVSLRAMAVLCRSGSTPHASTEAPPNASDSSGGGGGGGGSSSSTAEPGSKPGGPREKGTLFAWVSDALACRDPRMQLIGQCAVKWTIMADVKDAAMVRVLIQLAYGMSVAASIPGSSLHPAPASEGKGAAQSGKGAGQSGNAASGLGLLLGAHDGAAAAAAGQTRHRSMSDAPAPVSAQPSSRTVLGYLQALTAVLAPATGSAQPAAECGFVGAGVHSVLASRSLSHTYVGLLLPLATFHLYAERNRTRRQALLLLRALCIHTSADACLCNLDALGTSIVADIPAIASSAVVRLSESIARAFSVHTQVVVLEVVRQVHVQASLGGRVATLQALVRPWLANVELRSANYADDSELAFDLSPIALSHESLVILRCMLYLTVKTGLDSMSAMQTLWMALVDHDTRTHSPSRSANMWLVIRYLIGLLGCAWSTSLLGFTRRIVVFLSRSSQGRLLVQQFADEAMRPSAALPMDVSGVLAQRAMDNAIPSEAWAKEIQFLTQTKPHSERSLLSSGALAVFYLSAISYEQAPLLAGYKSLAILPPVVFMLAHPERRVRDAARTVLVNMVSSERAECISAGHTANRGRIDGLQPATVGYEQAVNESAHVALAVLRGEECLGGFGNVDVAAESAPAEHPEPAARQASPDTDAQALNDSTELLSNEWATTVPGWSCDFTTGRGAGPRQEESLGAARQGGLASTGGMPADAPDLLGLGFGSAEGDDAASSLRTDVNSDVVDPSLVADVAAMPAAMSQTASLAEHSASGPAHQPAPSESVCFDAGAGPGPRSAADADSGRLPLAVSRRSSIVDYLHGDAAGRERASLQRFVVSLSRLFGRHYPGCVQGWADAAVQWAMSCPVRPLAGLALQVFGVLAAEAQYGGPVVITPTRQIVLRLVDRLSNVIGDPSPELGAFAETVLAGIRQTAGLAARMCAEDEDINSDLLATGLVLMRTTQSAGVYSMALGVFERVIQLADADETRFRECVTERVGWLCADGYQAALLRGLEFAACRDRSLSLLRETLKYDMAPEAVVSGCRAHPMLTLASQIPALIEEAVQDAAAVQRAFLQSTRAADGNTGGSVGAGGGVQLRRDAHRHNVRRAGAPNATASALGSSLGLMFTGANPDASPAQTTRQSPRRPLFRRRGHGQWGWQREPDVADSTADASEGDDGAAQECLADSLASVASSSSTNNNEEKNGIDERCAAFIEQCAQGLVLATSGGMKDVRLLVKRLQALLVPPADAMAAQRVSEVARESVELFGYAVVECGPDIAGQVVVLLLQLLHPTGRARLALRYLRDEQMARTVGEQAHATGAAEMAVGYASELRRIYVCLQLIHSVLAAGDTGGGRAAGLRMDAAMAPSLRHLFDLLIVARPISDLASRVLNTLLQRFNDALPTPAARGLAPLSQCGMAAHGFQWYESNAVTLVEAARAALAEIVAMGFDAEEAAVACASNDSRGDSTDASLHGGTLAMALGCASATPRSASPEMPVLVIPDASEDEVRVERLCGYDGDHGAIGFAEQRVAEEDHDEIGEECDQSDKDTHDIMAELDDFDRELDAALDS